MPYSILARFYDELMPQVPAMNRHARRRMLGQILGRARAVCDLACGTGETALDFSRLGKKVFAVDNSPALCRIVRAKARRAHVVVRVVCADMRSFRLPEPVDLVTCEFAALNHLPRHAELARAFRAVARALQPGGWFLFDLNTCQAFAEQTPKGEWIETKAFKLVMRGRYEPRRRRAVLHFEWFLPAGKRWPRLKSATASHGRGWCHVRESVPHICWSDAEIRRALARAGFFRVRFRDGVDVRPPMPGARRGFDAYYLAQKRSG
jgi:SAM-dependent methyltransferase